VSLVLPGGSVTIHKHKGRTYNIYPDRRNPDVDLFSQLTEWMKILEHHVYGRQLEPNDFIFPTLNSNGTLRIGTMVSHDTILDLITQISSAAQVVPSTGKFTTHSFRRGGCQLKFTYANVGDCWPLVKVRWWGGWAEGEHVSAL
jgi:hypothetical protein